MTERSTTATENVKKESKDEFQDDLKTKPPDDGHGSSDGVESGETTPCDPEEEILYETRPTLKPTLIVFGLATAVWMAVVVTLWRNPELVGTTELTSIVEIVFHLVFAFVTIRLCARLYVLKRMRYQVNEDHVAREYALLYRYRRREVPIEQIRATEVRRDPLETLLGYGTLNVLTTGVNRSLGFVEFTNVPKPKAVNDAINTARGNDR